MSRMLALTLAQLWLSVGPPIQRPSDGPTPEARSVKDESDLDPDSGRGPGPEPPLLASEGVPLRWQAPLECPDEAALRERVHALVPGLLERPDAAGSRVEIEVWAAQDVDPLPGPRRSYMASVLVRNSDGETRREFAAPDCEIVADAAALILAVTLDPVGVSVGLSAGPMPEARSMKDESDVVPDSGRGRSPERPLLGGHAPASSEPAVEPEQPPAKRELPVETEPVERPPAIDRASGLGVGVRVLGGGGYGPTNTGYATIGGTLALLGPRWRVELGGLWAIPRVVRVDAGFGGRFDGWAVIGRGCFAPKLRRLELPSCGGVELGSVRGRGLEDLPISGRASFLWVALAVAQGLWFSPIERVGIGLELGLAVPLNRGGFAIETSAVQQISAVTVRGLAGVELRW